MKFNPVFYTLIIIFLLISNCKLLAQNTEIKYLSGTGNDHTVQWDFFCTKGSNSGKWSKIQVPSNWELQGFGTYNYGHDKPKADEQGIYRYSFDVPTNWKNKTVNIVFEGSMTDTKVMINGIIAGEVHQGGFYRFNYNIGKILKFGKMNTLEVTVNKVSANNTVNEAERAADYWVFGGIYRPVYLEALPKKHIERVAIDAKADGSFLMEVYTQGITGKCAVDAEIYTSEGKLLGKVPAVNVDPAQGKVTLSSLFPEALTWNPEFPNLYEVIVYLRDASGTVHQIKQKFGFRTVEVRLQDGIYVNGEKIMFRGVCRHTFWPESGRTTNKNISIQDVNLMKDMNMNAVRMSHYPPDQHFLDVCDSLGLFVLDEIAGWQFPPYDTLVGKKIVKSTVTRDVNHPSIILWDNGNEGGFNPGLRDEYALYDPQKRKVIEPWATLNGMNTHHYIPYNYGVKECFNGTDIFFPTEFLHGLFDGGHGAGLDDYWNLMLSNPLSAGGFLWVLTDEGVVRRDLKDSIDVWKNNAPDGIVGPYREKEGSFYTIKDIWSPVQFEKKIITEAFDGVFTIANRFNYTNLKDCSFKCELIQYTGTFPGLKQETVAIAVNPVDLSSGSKGLMNLNLPEDWKAFDVIMISATDPHGRNINSWTWNISRPQKIAERMINPQAPQTEISVKDNLIIIKSGAYEYSFDKTTGHLSRIICGGKSISFSNGPLIVGNPTTFKELKQYSEGEKTIVEAVYDEKSRCHVKWTILAEGWLQLEYDYRPYGSSDYWGISFKYPENNVTGATLLANGPYRVWKNRTRGPLFGLYSKTYNNTVTGESWEYPEFKGYYSNFYAVEVQTKEMPFTIISTTEDLYLHLFTPQAPKHAIGSVTPPFPDGDISIMHAISPIGTKFSRPETSGPQGWKNEYHPNPNTSSLSGKLYFRFGGL